MRPLPAEDDAGLPIAIAVSWPTGVVVIPTELVAISRPSDVVIERLSAPS
jgi:hypothetical protein